MHDLLGREGFLEMFAFKAEASRPSKPRERTPTAQLEDQVKLSEDTMYGEVAAESEYRCIVYDRVARTDALSSW